MKPLKTLLIVGVLFGAVTLSSYAIDEDAINQLANLVTEYLLKKPDERPLEAFLDAYRDQVKSNPNTNLVEFIKSYFVAHPEFEEYINNYLAWYKAQPKYVTHPELADALAGLLKKGDALTAADLDAVIADLKAKGIIVSKDELQALLDKCKKDNCTLTTSDDLKKALEKALEKLSSTTDKDLNALLDEIKKMTQAQKDYLNNLASQLSSLPQSQQAANDKQKPEDNNMMMMIMMLLMMMMQGGDKKC